MNCPFCNTPVDEHPANRCMDAWAAKSFGWTKKVYDNEPNGAWCWEGEHQGDGVRSFVAFSDWSPSTDIAAAMGALEGWLAIHNRRVCEIDWGGAKGLWGVGLYLSRDPARIPEWWGDAETLRLAICRAIIKAKENEHAG